jgi:NAD(P)-dependent dehydrogenase (short-subunit alcohol dehydrogenase family)
MSTPERPKGCAVVTGASRGIGAAVAQRLERDGWTVARLSRGGDDNGNGYRVDVSDRGQVDDAFKRIESELGPPLVLVNNAGVRRDGLAIRMGSDQWDEVVATNLTGVFNCTRVALGSMLSARWGRIVNVSSVVAERANAGQANYAAAKAGVLALTRTVAREMARKGITCNAVVPGLIDTEMTADVRDDLLPAIPAARAGTPDDVAACVSFLCSEDAGYVTGAALAVDGGMGS